MSGMTTFDDYVAALASAMGSAATLPLGTWHVPAWPAPAEGAPVAVIASPHPDDEAIIGGLPLRLRREAGWRVVNLAITLGSDPGRREARRTELEGCCRALGFDLVVAGGEGLGQVRFSTRRDDPVLWERHVGAVASVLASLKPSAVFLPHAADGHPTHIGTHWLVRHALLRAAPALDELRLVETEYWHAMETPNLMVESSQGDVADLLAALSFHVGEVRRNPYHLTLPFWMADNVRRGSERIGGAGTSAAPFRFATLYRQLRLPSGGPAHTLPSALVPADFDWASW